MDFRYLFEVPENSSKLVLERSKNFSMHLYDSDPKYHENSSRWEIFEDTCTLLIHTSEEVSESEFLQYFLPLSGGAKIRILSQKNVYDSEDKCESSVVSVFEIEDGHVTIIYNNVSPLTWFSLHNINLISQYSRKILYREGNHLTHGYLHNRRSFDYFFRTDEINEDLDRKISLLRSSGVSFGK